MGQQPDRLEWQRLQQATTPDGSGDGCLQLRLGGILSRGVHRGLLGASGKSTPYQRTGVVGSLFWSQSVRKTQTRDKHSTVVGQSDSSVSYQQNGRHQVTHSSGPYKNSVAMVPRVQNFVGSTTHTRKGQLQSRLLVTASQRQDRLNSESGALQCHQPAMGTSRGRPVCQQVFCTAATFLQLATRPRGGSNRCLCSGLECKERVCTSPLVFDISGALQGASSASLPGAGGTSLANTSLVPCSSVNAGGHPYPAPNEAGHFDSIPQLRLSSPGHSTQAGPLESLRQRFRQETISEEAIKLILASWREKTNANYNSSWRKWEQWCTPRGLNPISAGISEILDFLAMQFQEGRMYRSLNCYRSAISSVHLPVDGFQVGQHPLVARLLKGVFNSRPPMPRYKDTWEVSKVLRYLQSIGPNESLSLKDLTKKLAMLLALSLANQSSDLVRLSLEGRRYTPDGVHISPVGLAKQSNPQRTSGRLPVFIPMFQEDQLLCPVACLQVYEKRTEEARNGHATVSVNIGSSQPCIIIHNCKVD